jgi:hypothetical protein
VHSGKKFCYGQQLIVHEQLRFVLFVWSFVFKIGKSNIASPNYFKNGGVVLPHVVLNGKAAIENIFKELKPLMIRNENSILKTTDVYLEHEKCDTYRFISY